MTSLNNNTMLRSAEGIGTMEREPISKNRVSPKNDRSRRNLLVLATILLCALLGFGHKVAAQDNFVGNQPPNKKTEPVTSVITRFTRFTNTVIRLGFGSVESSKKPLYAISYNDGNLYKREWDDYEKKYTSEELILPDVKDIQASVAFFALQNDGTLWGWGDNSKGQLGDNTGINKDKPIKIMVDVKDFYTYQASVWAVKNDGTVWAWGQNEYKSNRGNSYLLGVGDKEDRYAPEKLPLENIAYVYSGLGMHYPNNVHNTWEVTAVVTTSGDEYIWGATRTSLYRIGNILTPTFVGKHNDAKKFCFQICVGKTDCSYYLSPIGSLYKGNEIIAQNIADCHERIEGSDAIIYLTVDGDVYSSGQPVGDGTNLPRKTPVLVLQNVIQLNYDQGYNKGYNSKTIRPLTTTGQLYELDTKETFKYQPMDSAYLSFHDVRYTIDGRHIIQNSPTWVQDIALPQIKQ